MTKLSSFAPILPNVVYKIDHIWKNTKRKRWKIDFAFVSEHCASFRTKNWTFFVHIPSILSTTSTLSQKLKIGELIFHSFQNIAQLYGTKTQLGHFCGGEGGFCMSLIRTGPTFLLDLAQQTLFLLTLNQSKKMTSPNLAPQLSQSTSPHRMWI